MAMKKLYRLTKDGVAELQSERDSLANERSAIADRIKTAREFGDLAENFEYSAARLEQERNEARISEIDAILQNVEIITTAKSNGKVSLGSHVTLKSGSNQKEFQVVGTVEADPLAGKISDESPIGRALMGKKVGEDVEIKTPADTTVYTLVSIA